MPLKRFVRGALWAILLAPIVVISDEPSIPPGDCYGIQGFVLENGSPVADYTVVLLFKIDANNPWRRSTGIDITDGRGIFRVNSCDGSPVDSIAAAVVTPDTTIMSQAFSTSGLFVSKEEEPRVDDGFFCDDTTWEVVNYVHDTIDSVVINVPSQVRARRRWVVGSFFTPIMGVKNHPKIGLAARD